MEAIKFGCWSVLRMLIVVMLCAISSSWSMHLYAHEPIKTQQQRMQYYGKQRGPHNIFFVQTTCAIENVSWSGLNPRQACAVESAVRHNPSCAVYVLHTCHSPEIGLSLPAGVSAMHVGFAEFLRDTRLYTPLIEGRAIFRSKFPVKHASDVMRVVALWKFGGLYLDLDYVVLRNMTVLGEDWFPARDDDVFGSSAMCMSAQPGSAGRQVSTAFMEELRTSSVGQLWSSHGHGILKRLMGTRCNAKKVMDMKDCHGFRVLPTTVLFPVLLKDWRRLFQEEGADRTLADVRNSFAVHLWSSHSRDVVSVPIKSPYAILARENCPDTFSTAKGRF